MKIKKDNTIIVKECDKGGACHNGCKFYTEKMCNIVCDEFTYKQLEKNIDNKTRKLMEKLTEKYKASLTKMDINYLTKCQVTSSHLYGLPKIHKSTIINNENKKNPSEIIKSQNPEDLTFRPMVAGPNCVTSRLSNFIDISVKTFLQKIKSYVRDGLDFLNKIPKKLAEYESLVTLDVSNICHKILVTTTSICNYRRSTK